MSPSLPGHANYERDRSPEFHARKFSVAEPLSESRKLRLHLRTFHLLFVRFRILRSQAEPSLSKSFPTKTSLRTLRENHPQRTKPPLPFANSSLHASSLRTFSRTFRPFFVRFVLVHSSSLIQPILRQSPTTRTFFRTFPLFIFPPLQLLLPSQLVKSSHGPRWSYCSGRRVDAAQVVFR